MHLREKELYRQHKALRKLERAGHSVFYVTSQIDGPVALSNAYVNNTVVDSAAALFSPLEIKLPTETEPHHVTFEADADYGFIYSEEGRRFKRKFSRFEVALEESMLTRRQTATQNRDILSEFVSWAREVSPQGSAAFHIAGRFDDPAIKASILAFFLLDTQLTFVRK